ncbi:MAG: bifunctional DNA primase/polymerase [Planctomycetota bacterium]
MSQNLAASPQEVAKAALDYRKLGFYSIPIPLGEKGPKTKDWQKSRHQENDIPRIFERSCNIGLLLGEPSGWLVDIDLDCQEAVALAPDFLPPTGWISGRRTKPKSHYWYIAKILKSKKFQDDKGMLVEIRSTGGQTVVPPSTHPSGERYEWAEHDHPAKIAAAELHRAVSYLAAAALLARNWPKEGNRQNIALAVSGYLLRGGLPQEDVAKIVESAARVAGDEEHDKRAATVANSAAKLGNNEPTTGGPSLADLTSGKVVELLEKWLNLKARSSVGQRKSKRTQAAALIEMSDALEVFHDSLKQGFVRFPVKNHFETWPILSKEFRRHLVGLFYRKFKEVPKSEAQKSCLDYLEMKAVQDGPEQQLFIRAGEDRHALYLDLCNPNWEVVRIAPDKIEVIQECPIRFRRTKGMLELPTPFGGGSVDDLRRFLNAQDDSNWILMLAWLLATFRPRGPFPVLVINGEQGSAKTTTTRVLRKLVDPSEADLRSQPRDERDLAIAANNAHVVGYDNLSAIPGWLSDALCRVATGGALATRKLYSDDEESIFKFQKPCIVNGIPDLATRSDLLDRSIALTLPPISESKRLAEKAFWKEFDEAKPRILGALLAVVSQALGRVNHVSLERLPRMADFAIWATACLESLGMAHGAFLKAYESNRQEGNVVAIESSPVAKAIIALLRGKPEWSGTASELLHTFGVSGDNQIEPKTWPKTPTQLSGVIREIAPNLRVSQWIDVEFKKVNHERRIFLRKLK